VSGDGGVGKGRDNIPQGRVRRAAPIAGLAARTAGEAVVVALRGRVSGADAAARQKAEFQARTAERYAELMGRSKGALMKIAQMMSFLSLGTGPVAYQSALGKLRASAPPMEASLAREALERELGMPTAEAFAEFDWEPLAAASIGQVHEARMHDGRRVAVKIQYPGVAAAIKSDLSNGELLATFLGMANGLAPRGLRADLREYAKEAEIRVTEELDYRLEAANQKEFASIYRGHPFIRVPEVIEELSTERVITQDFVEGLTWDEAMVADQDLKDRWGEAIHRFTYGSWHRLGRFNADAHPGNYLFHDDGSVSFLDFGCVMKFGPAEVKVIDGPVRAAVHADVEGTWLASLAGGAFKQGDPVTVQEVYEFWRRPLEMYWAEQPFTVTPERASAWIEQRYSPGGPSANAVRCSAPPRGWAMMMRIEMGVMSLLAELRATSDWRSIYLERGEDARPPLTEYGKLEHAFFDEREPVGTHA
jgi:predicted unusual protein kinase regulating ubiquinone biosynthesis (AarF/ABC1/UbiB family)